MNTTLLKNFLRKVEPKKMLLGSQQRLNFNSINNLHYAYEFQTNLSVFK